MNSEKAGIPRSLVTCGKMKSSFKAQNHAANIL